jgi:Zn-dependent peptidase ImmA (M78 family)
VPSLHANRGAKRAREARAELSIARDAQLACTVTAIERAGVGVLVLDLPAGVAGAYNPAGPWIFVNGRQQVVRQRFTVAHEFGHHRLGHRDLKILDSPADIAGKAHARDWREVQANAFAAEFLAPISGVRAWWREQEPDAANLEAVCRLACEFGVSAIAAAYRLNAAGLADLRRVERLKREIEEDMMHVQLMEQLGLDPRHDDVLQRVADEGRARLPPALASSPLGAYLRRDVTLDEAARRAGCAPAKLAAAVEALRI